MKLTTHNEFSATNETVTESQLLTFRDQSTLQDQLNSAAFDVEAVYGDWHRTAFSDTDTLMVFVARAR